MGWALDVVNRVFPDRRQRPVLVYVSENHEETTRFRMARNYGGNLLTRAMLHVDANKATYLERALVTAADLVTTTTPADAALFAATHPDKQYLTITPGYGGRVVSTRLITRDSPRRAVVLGSFDWLAKQIDLREFLETADGMFAAARVELHVVGRAPAPLLDRLRSRFQTTTFSGPVQDTSGYLDGARIGIVPERTGHGFKLKVLDYVFNRVPVGALHEGVLGMGIPLAPDDNMLTYPDMSALCRGVLGIIDDVHRLNQLQQSAFRKCVGEFAWESRGVRLLEEVGRLVAARKAA